MSDNLVVEIIDDTGDVLDKPKSAVEEYIQIRGWGDVVKIASDINTDNVVGFGDAKTYDWEVGQMIWKNVVLSTKPFNHKTNHEKDRIISIYKYIASFLNSGEYPLMAQLWNYLGVTQQEFFGAMSNNGHPDKDVFTWSFSVFDACASLNAIRSNGNVSARQWIDKTREYRVSADTELEMAVERQKIEMQNEIGRRIQEAIELEMMEE